MKQLPQHITNKEGFGLIETIVAIFVLTIAITGALSLSDYVSNVFGRSKIEIMATSHAVDGIELVRNIRDTNWLYFGEGQARQRWGALIDTEEVADAYKDGTYIISYCSEGGENCPSITARQFDAFMTPVDNIDPNKAYFDERLTLWQQTIPDESRPGEEIEIITQNIDPLDTPTPFGFKRYITIKYLDTDLDPNKEVSLGETESSNAMLVTSRVIWQTETLGIKKEISIETILTDWYKRKNHDDIVN